MNYNELPLVSKVEPLVLMIMHGFALSALVLASNLNYVRLPEFSVLIVLLIIIGKVQRRMIEVSHKICSKVCPLFILGWNNLLANLKKSSR